MTEVETKTYARRLIVELFEQLSKDHVRFQREEAQTLRDKQRGLDAEVEGALNLLINGQLLPLEMRPLVKLRALDEFLNEEISVRYFVGSAFPVTLGDGQRFFLYRRPLGPRRAAIEGQMGHLRTWLLHHWVIPAELHGYQVDVLPPNPFLNTKFEALRRNHEPLRVAISHFNDGVELLWREELRPDMQAVDLRDPDTRWNQVELLLREALRRKVHILVLPELTITPLLRRKLQDWLRVRLKTHAFVMVLPGSFHEADASRPGEVFNQTQLLDAGGRVVMEHRKFTTFGRQNAFENIQLGSRIKLLPLPIGLLATPICLDFCQSGQPIREIWKALGPEWLLVPAYGNASSMSAHRAAAKELRVSHGSRTVLANQPKDAEPARGFIDGEEAAEQAPPFQVAELNIWPEEPQPERNKRGTGWVN